MYKEASRIDRRPPLELQLEAAKRPRGAVNPILGTQIYAERRQTLLIDTQRTFIAFRRAFIFDIYRNKHLAQND